MAPARLLALLLLPSLLLISLISPSCSTPPSTHSHHHASHSGGEGEGRPTVRRSVGESRASSAASSSACSGGSHGASGQFDFYVLALSSSPEYCASSSTYSKYPGCVHPTAWQAVNLTMHGLWPQYNAEQSGYYGPECCATQFGSTLTQAAVTPLLPQLERQWPNEQDPTGATLGLASTLWAHEWAVHGTCSGLSQSAFLTTALHTALTLPTPSIITTHIGGSTTRDAIESAFNGGSPCVSGAACNVFLECASTNTLEGVNVCYSTQLQRMECPAVVTQASSRCKAGSVKIAGFKKASASASQGHTQAQAELR